MLLFCTENTNSFLLRKEVHAFLLKETVREKYVLHTLKTHPKSAQGAEFSKPQKLLIQGWICYISVMVILISHCLSQAQVQYLQSCVRGKWENSALNSLVCDKNIDLLSSILFKSPKLQFKLNTSCPITYNRHKQQPFISLEILKFPSVFCPKAYEICSASPHSMFSGNLTWTVVN